MSIVKTHRDLDVWKKSVALVTTVYELTKGFPKEEIYGITNQMTHLFTFLALRRYETSNSLDIVDYF